MLPISASTVVIGGGIIGASTLYHLAKAGAPSPVLIERKKIASGTTWHAAGIVGQLRDSAAQTELSKYTARLFKDLEAETGQATGYKQNGTMHLALSDLRMEQLLRTSDHSVRMGIETQILDIEGIAAFWPTLRLDDVKGGILVPSNGQVNPLDVTMALIRGAKALGAQVFEETEVLSLGLKGDQVQSVETTAGSIATDQVLLAAGMWSADFARKHGVTIPSQAAEHWYIVTEPMEGLPKNQPSMVVLEERSYWKEDAGKLLIGAFESRGKSYGDKGIPQTFEFDELPFDMDHVSTELEAMFQRMPSLESVGIQTFFNGPESFTVDGRPYLGPAPELKGLFIATGMNSNGILNSGGVGLTMAQWMLEGSPQRGMSALAATRAQPFQRNKAYNLERVREAVGFHYGLHWPGRQVETARGLRRLPLHAELKDQGALFSERYGWEVPMVFDPSGENLWPTEPSLRGQTWSPWVKAECQAAHSQAVLLDQSMYAKIVVQGPDALTLLNSVCCSDMNCPVGQSVYTQFLNTKGGIEADLTVTRLEQEKFIIISGHPSQTRDQTWLKANKQESWRVEIFDATSAFALPTVHGPKSREILQAISGDGLAEANLPFGAAKEIDLGFTRAWVLRRSFLGELGFELLFPTEFAGHVFEEIWRIGKTLGLRPMGMFAMNACRLEKGFRHFGHDMAEEDTPFEVGLGFAVDLNKPHFIGKDFIQAQRANSPIPQYRTVSLRVPSLSEQEGPYLIHNEPLWREGNLVGHVTSGAWGHRLETMIGLASLHRPEGVSKTWIEEGDFTVQIAGQHFAADLSLKPFFDPNSHIMRDLGAAK